MNQEKISDHSAILLAAGYGSRIASETNSPKCLLPLAGKTLLERHFHAWKEAGIKKVILVLGYKAEEIRKVADQYSNEFQIKYCLNETYRTHGNTYSLLLGLEACEGPSVIFDADLVYESKILTNFLADPSANKILVGPADINDIECTKALTDKNDFIRRVVDKRAVTEIESQQWRFVGEAMGVLKFSADATRYLKEEAHLFLSEKKNLLLNWENLLNIILPKCEVNSHQTTSEYWIEIDTPEDYFEAQGLFVE